jgi:putative transposase
MKKHRTEFRVTTMSRVLGVHRSGFYAWLKKPESARTAQNRQLVEKIRHFWGESDYAYGSPRIYTDLREAGVVCGKNRVARLMAKHGIRAQLAMKRRRYRPGKPSQVVPNVVEQEFQVSETNTVWATDITHIRTLEGWLYVAVVMDLCSRRIVGWSMQATMHRDLVIQALLCAKWRRYPNRKVIIHSDQGAQYGSDDWARFCRDNRFLPSMSRRGNAYDNAPVESFFASLKKERTRRRSYRTRDEARADIFDYIEHFYNRKRRHEHLGHRSPVDYEAALKAG